MKTSKNTLRKIVAAAAIALGASVAAAGTSTVHFQSDSAKSTKKLGSFKGAASYDDATNLLTVILENTTAAARGGHLTGLAFNLKGEAKAVYLDADTLGATDGEDAFADARSTKGQVKAKPFGKFDAGAALDGKWGRNKAAGRGVAAGSARTFVFDVDGGAGMTAADFFLGDTSVAASFKVGKKGKDRVAGALIPEDLVPPTHSNPTDGNLPAGQTPDPAGGDSAPAGNNGPTAPGADAAGGAKQTPVDGPVSPTRPVILPPRIVLPPSGEAEIIFPTGPVTIDGGASRGVSPVTVPLPPAVWPALSTFGLLGAARLKRKLGKRA